ncbi:MAG: flagellar motor protein MotB [SAR324 cluster bacterium]|nr:flagellar motor protein MotB [SAR324 cluster bacterium]
MAQENERSTELQEEIKLLKPSKRKKKEDENGFDPNGWMITFSDLITLMMTFFVLLFSFNEPNPSKLDAVSSSAPGLFSLSESALSQAVPIQEANSLLKENLEIFLSENNVKNVDLSQGNEGLLITLPTDIIFEKNSAYLSEKSKRIIQRVTNYLNKTQHQIRVEGHTDNTPVNTKDDQDSWGLSLSRAHAILQEMLKAGMNPKRLALVGKGDAQPKFSNADSKGRDANRRVEIVVFNTN